MVTIHNLEVRFDVEGEEDESVFAMLFQRYIGRWSKAYEEERCRREDVERERSLGDRPESDVR